ncbi:MAG: hypothetical protein KF819_03420 [Labilithrix sp.]|nr:hypothetical protein [Labilithrix sp.]
MDTGDFDEEAFFRAIASSGARALLIGRRAMAVLALPVLTADYDFWIAFDDVELLNAALEPLDFVPNKTPEGARRTGMYALENSEHVDVLIARSIPTVDGVAVAFEDVWPRRQSVAYASGVEIVLPSLDDLILTKRFGARTRDVADISLLEALKRGGPS